MDQELIWSARINRPRAPTLLAAKRRQPKPFRHRIHSGHQLSSCLQEAPDSQRGLCRTVPYQHSFVVLLLRAVDMALSMGGLVHLKRQPGCLALRSALVPGASLGISKSSPSPLPAAPGLDLVSSIPLPFLAPVLEKPIRCHVRHRGFPELGRSDFRCAFSEWFILSYFPFLSNRVPLVPPAKKERYVWLLAGSCPERFGSKHAYCIF